MLKAKSLHIADGTEVFKGLEERNKELGNGSIFFSVRESLIPLEDYVEDRTFERVDRILKELAKEQQTEYRILRHARLVNGRGMNTTEFEMVFEFDGISYIIFRKSEKNAEVFGKIRRVGGRYPIPPERILLVDSSITEEYAKLLEMFCDYHVANQNERCLKQKIVEMIVQETKEGEGKNDRI